jgi:hypothetical protein
MVTKKVAEIFSCVSRNSMKKLQSLGGHFLVRHLKLNTPKLKSVSMQSLIDKLASLTSHSHFAHSLLFCLKTSVLAKIKSGNTHYKQRCGTEHLLHHWWEYKVIQQVGMVAHL